MTNSVFLKLTSQSGHNPVTPDTTYLYSRTDGFDSFFSETGRRTVRGDGVVCISPFDYIKSSTFDEIHDFSVFFQFCQKRLRYCGF